MTPSESRTNSPVNTVPGLMNVIQIWLRCSHPMLTLITSIPMTAIHERMDVLIAVFLMLDRLTAI
jgi:hypothetical protein